MFKKIFTAISLISSLAFTNASAQGWPSQYEGVMLQGFYWDSYTDSKWTKLEKQADELARYFDLVWVPNSGYCSGSNNMGYLPLYYFNQQSSFGSEEELRSMIATFKSKGLGTIADVVINHHANVSSWVDFPSETYKATTYQLKSTDICMNDDGGACKSWADKNGISISSNNDTGEDWSGARDLDHKSDNVKKVINTYLDFLLNDLGYTGFRYDMVKGYSANFTADYNTTAKPSFSVGEYWDSSSKIKTWIDGTKRNNVPTSAAFDFQFRYRVRDAINQNNWTKLADNPNDAGGRPLIYDSNYRQYAVTFVENHDTEKRASAEQDPIKGDTLSANAYLLAMPGTPCVFFKHWINAKGDIKRMIAARKLVGITNTSTYEQKASAQLYYAIETKGEKGSLICVVGKTPTAYAAPSGYTKICSGNGYIYYVNDDLASSWTAINNRIDEEQKAEKEEQDNFKPYTANIYVKANFTPVYFYVWDSNNNSQLNGNWPGKLMTGSTVTINGETWYHQTFDIKSYDYFFNIIFNQGSGKAQTANIENITTDRYYEATLTGSTITYKDVTATTAIEDVKKDGNAASETFNLMGQRVKDLNPGKIYIRNGKKFIR